MLHTTAMDITNEQNPPARPPVPEQGVRSRPRPDVGVKRDVINPEQPEADEPLKPVPDMDPDGQDPDENETVN
jgi:hypothetical protein